MKAKLFALSLVALGCSYATITSAQVPTPTAAPALTLEQVEYDPQTPTLAAVLGYDFGERISSPTAINDYLQALAKAHPDRVKLFDYGRTWEGRPLIYAVISSAENIAQLDTFANNMQALADPRLTSEADAKSLMADMPSSIWLSYGVHGNEISSPEAALLTAYHLLAANDASTAAWLDNTMVFIDPLQNPDGRARFVSRYYATVGLEHSSDRLSAEHNEPWPNGRTNHYLFDMNRDWLALTQPEIAGQVAELQKYYPLAFVDLHEMGGDMSYYFTPEAEPYNPYITESQRAGLDAIGRNNAKWFDSEGFDYFTREIFDAFYPGYGASWPAYHGALSMTYEMASARGHKFRTKNGDILTYGDGVYRHFIASISTIETVSRERQRLLQDFWNYRTSAIREGRNHDERYLLFPANRDAAATQKLMALLDDHGIDVEQAQESFSVCRTEFPAGSFIIDKAQPAYRMIGTLLDQQIDMADDFIAIQEQRRSNNLPDQIYDVTGWSLPLLFNVPPIACEDNPRVARTLVDPEYIEPGVVSNADAEVAFIVNWGDMNAGRFMTAALREGLAVKSSDLAFTLDSGAQFNAGSLILTRADNGPDLTQQVTTLAQQTGATVIGVDSSWVTDGPNFGSMNVQQLHAPDVAMLWDEPASVLSAGNTRFVIERQFNYPVTAIRPERLASADLSHYEVLILPSGYGNYEQALGQRGAQNLKLWVQRGGVLLTIGNATRFAVDNGLLDSSRELAKSAKQGLEIDDQQRTEGYTLDSAADLQHAISPVDVDPYWVSGVIATTTIDQNHWLSAGVPDTVYSLIAGNDIYTPLTIDDGRNIGYFAAADELMASGYLWQENIDQLAYKPFLMWQPQQRGMVISYTQEPAYRAYMDGLNLLLLNSIFKAPAHADKLR